MINSRVPRLPRNANGKLSDLLIDKYETVSKLRLIEACRWQARDSVDGRTANLIASLLRSNDDELPQLRLGKKFVMVISSVDNRFASLSLRQALDSESLRLSRSSQHKSKVFRWKHFYWGALLPLFGTTNYTTRFITADFILTEPNRNLFHTPLLASSRRWEHEFSRKPEETTWIIYRMIIIIKTFHERWARRRRRGENINRQYVSWRRILCGRASEGMSNIKSESPNQLKLASSFRDCRDVDRFYWRQCSINGI